MNGKWEGHLTHIDPFKWDFGCNTIHICAGLEETETDIFRNTLEQRLDTSLNLETGSNAPLL